MTQSERSDSDPVAGYIRFSSGAPDVPVNRDSEGLFRDLMGNLFCGWVWIGRDGCWYGQRMSKMDKSNSDG